MEHIRRVIRALLVLIALAPTAHAQPVEPLQLYGSLSTTEIQPGDTFSASLAVYSTSPEPLTLELDAPTPVGMTLLATTWTTDTISQDHPVSITLTYRVDQIPPDGRLQVMAYTVKDGVENLAAEWLLIRVGTVQWPDALLVRLWLPMVGK